MFLLANLLPHEATVETARWVGGVIAAVVIGWATSRFQQGGRRRRLRRDIREELELVQALEKDGDKALAASASRLRGEVIGLVHEYMPQDLGEILRETSEPDPGTMFVQAFATTSFVAGLALLVHVPGLLALALGLGVAAGFGYPNFRRWRRKDESTSAS